MIGRDAGYDHPAAALASPAFRTAFPYVTPRRVLELQDDVFSCPENTFDAQVFGEGFVPNEIALPWNAGEILDELLILEQEFSLHRI